MDSPNAVTLKFPTFRYARKKASVYFSGVIFNLNLS